MFANPGTYTVTFTATDALGLADPTPDSRIITVYAAGGCPASLLPNPSFETDVTGWKGIGATIARVAGGSSGSFSCRVTSPASTSALGIQRTRPATRPRAGPSPEAFAPTVEPRDRAESHTEGVASLHGVRCG